MVVVLPEPDSPTSAWVVPAGTLKETLLTAVSTLSPTLKFLVTALTAIFGVVVDSAFSRRKPGSRSRA
ncbi:hypothetical protein D3C80_1634560 [compost metagenome]